jgi:hypothetical protein
LEVDCTTQPHKLNQIEKNTMSVKTTKSRAKSSTTKAKATKAKEVGTIIETITATELTDLQRIETATKLLEPVTEVMLLAVVEDEDGNPVLQLPQRTMQFATDLAGIAKSHPEKLRRDQAGKLLDCLQGRTTIDANGIEKATGLGCYSVKQVDFLRQARGNNKMRGASKTGTQYSFGE